MELPDWSPVYAYVLQLEQEGLVTRTFRRLDPQRQQAILSAILDEATARGPTAINIKKVAAQAGVSVGSLYTYFRNRQGLLDFAIALCVRFLTGMFVQYQPYLAALPLREALVAYLSGGIEWSKTQAGLLSFFARAAYHGDPALAEPVVRPIASAMREVIYDMLVQAAARGEIRPDVDLEATARILHAATIAVGDPQLLPYLNNYFQVTGEDVSPERAMAAFLELVMRGIGRSEGAPSGQSPRRDFRAGDEEAEDAALEPGSGR